MRFAILASGAGSIVDHILKAQKNGLLNHECVLVVTDRPSAGVLTVADRYQAPSAIVDVAFHPNRDSWDTSVASVLKKSGCDFVLLAGFLRKLGPKTLGAFPDKIINTHPSLLPKYGGKGMYGNKVHEAVIAAKETESGVTIHLVNEEYDRGKILRQVRVPVSAGDTPATLEQRIKEQERALLVEFLNDWPN